MKVSLIQTSLAWENPEANRNNFSALIAGLSEPTDLIVLPEMFTSGFTMNPKAVAETMDGDTVAWMKQIAAEKDCAITGSFVVKEDGHHYNRMLFVLPNGEVQKYDKRHLFSLAGEEKEYKAGTEKLIVEYKGWKLCLLVCYDLRFPVFSRNTEGYDVMIYVASWPESRIFAWDSLLRARAIENMSYVIGVNRTGEDDDHYYHPGHSQVLDCLGADVLQAESKEGVFTVELDRDMLHQTREKFGFLEDRDSFNLQD